MIPDSICYRPLNVPRINAPNKFRSTQAALERIASGKLHPLRSRLRCHCIFAFCGETLGFNNLRVEDFPQVVNEKLYGIQPAPSSLRSPDPKLDTGWRPLPHANNSLSNWRCYLTLSFPELKYRGFGSAAEAEMLPQPKPRALREIFVVPSISSRDVACAEWPDIRRLGWILRHRR
jgi:hypothetical protein